MVFTPPGDRTRLPNRLFLFGLVLSVISSVTYSEPAARSADFQSISISGD